MINELTAEERLQAKQFDPLLSFYKIWGSWIRSAGTGPVHLTLAEANGVDVMAGDLQDQTPVHHIQQPVSEKLLLVVGDVLRGGETQLLQVDRSKQFFLVDHRTQVSVEEPAALWVTDGDGGAHFLPSVQKLHLQVCHCVTDKQADVKTFLLLFFS